MKHKRNTEGLATAAKERRQITIKRVNEAIHSLLQDKNTINFNSVSKTANVGKTWLYKEADIKAKILKFREKHIGSKSIRKEHNSSSASKNALLNMLKERISQAETENRELKKQIEILYGKLSVQV